MLYGSEVWGMSTARCTAGQTLLNKSMRIMAGRRAKDNHIPVAAMWRELGIPPVRAAAAARRARAVAKYPSLKTWVAVLCEEQYGQPGRLRVRAWWAASRIWLKSHKLYEIGGGESRGDVYDEVLKAEWRTAESTSTYKRSAQYIEHQYLSISPATAFPPPGQMEQVQLGPGLRMLSLCRTGGLWAAADMAKAKFIDRIYKEKCPCCNETVAGRGEDISHMVVECSKWERERELYLGRFIEELGDSGGSTQLGVFLLGGMIGEQRVENWLPPTGSRRYRPSRESILQCCAFEMARFLQSIKGRRKVVLTNLTLSSSNRAEARTGMAALEAQAS
jgi:hypothetical protein